MMEEQKTHFCLPYPRNKYSIWLINVVIMKKPNKKGYMWIILLIWTMLTQKIY